MDRIDQRCDACRKFDKHPRHIHLGPEGTMTYRHMDCCFNAGCPDESCDRILRDSGQAHGDDLVRFAASQ